MKDPTPTPNLDATGQNNTHHKKRQSFFTENKKSFLNIRKAFKDSRKKVFQDIKHKKKDEEVKQHHDDHNGRINAFGGKHQ